MTDDKSGTWRMDTLSAHGLGYIDPTTGGVVPPIQPATTFERAADNTYPRGYTYARPNHPTQDLPEQLIARLEGAAEARLFSSGLAAATSLFLALDPGDHVIAPAVMYWSLRGWLTGFASRWGVEVSLVDVADAEVLKAAIRPGKTRMVWVETPSNPLWQVVDIAQVAEIAHQAGALVAVDNTVPTPVLTRPIDLGADFVMHAATKALNGHSDVLAGVVAAADAGHPVWQRVLENRGGLGGVIGPFEAWLLMRGMRTLPLRVRAASANAQALAEHLSAHPKVARVYYPGLPDHPGHGIAARQMTGGFGTMLSAELAGGHAATMTFLARLSLWTRATSLGGVESLIEHRSSVEGPTSPIPPDLLRLSAGIEAVEDLVADLEEALAAV